MNFEKYTNEKKLKFVKIINDASISISDLLENLLNWSRAQSGNLRIQPGFINICILINENIQLVSELAKNKSISLQFESSQKEFKTIMDKNMIDAVLRNLLTNAIKFTPENGHISVDAKKLTEVLEVSVTDNGVGIKGEDIQKLFDKTSHFTTYGTRNEKGTGLGLIMCKDFIELHAGTLRVESEVNKGSSFIFTLPLKQPTDIYEIV